MNLDKVLLELTVQDVQEIPMIDLDGDPEKPLAFIRENLAMVASEIQIRNLQSPIKNL